MKNHEKLYRHLVSSEDRQHYLPTMLSRGLQEGMQWGQFDHSSIELDLSGSYRNQHNIRKRHSLERGHIALILSTPVISSF